MVLDLSSLRDALAALSVSLRYLDSDLAADPGFRDQFRAAAIQAFEFTYKRAFKDPPGNKCATLGGEAPARRGARSAHTGPYVSDEQRSPAGCIGVQNGAVIPGRVLSS